MHHGSKCFNLSSSRFQITVPLRIAQFCPGKTVLPDRLLAVHQEPAATILVGGRRSNAVVRRFSTLLRLHSVLQMSLYGGPYLMCVKGHTLQVRG